MIVGIPDSPTHFLYVPYGRKEVSDGRRGVVSRGAAGGPGRALGTLETKLGFPEGSGSVPERVKRIRNKVREAMFEDGIPAERLAELRKDLDRVFVAVQLYSYPGQYLRERPTRNRIAETIVKLHEDVMQEAPVLGKRAVSITFAEPLDMRDWLEAYAEDARLTVADVTAALETRIGEALDASG